MVDSLFVNVIDFPNYLVNRDGEVLSLNTYKILGYNLNSRGYKRVRMSNSSGTHKMFLHRLLAIHFIPNPENLPIIDHIDRDITNNSITNLRWSTISSNTRNTSQEKIDSKTSKYIGVAFRKDLNKYQSTFHYKKKLIHLGYYTNQIDAGKAYNEALLKYEITDRVPNIV